ncbi:MAG: hypothetical protein H0U67_03110 [Gemmatimonadetes bacterium]|nr:hypothetical protein [Gemmatimonadota bacterium]
MSTADLTELALEKMERDRDPEVIPSLVSIIRQQQHDLDSLRLALEVARGDREELRAALIAMRSGREDRDPGESG